MLAFNLFSLLIFGFVAWFAFSAVRVGCSGGPGSINNLPKAGWEFIKKIRDGGGFPE
ncbi:MAG: hypothetical protein OEZ59_08510 [Deltaproteobacteria bacterium]|nr:hypothetical protein [Deltaproteobacteria bacterium]